NISRTLCNACPLLDQAVHNRNKTSSRPSKFILLLAQQSNCPPPLIDSTDPHTLTPPSTPQSDRASPPSTPDRFRRSARRRSKPQSPAPLPTTAVQPESA